jgi:hypothetical protein
MRLRDLRSALGLEAPLLVNSAGRECLDPDCAPVRIHPGQPDAFKMCSRSSIET